MSANQLVIELPPPGTLIRDLALTAINLIGAFGRASISQRGDEIIISHINLPSALDRFTNEILQIYQAKNRYIRRWPALHVNDKNTLKKKIPGNQLDAINTYGDLAEYFIKQLSGRISRKNRLIVELSKNSILLGQAQEAFSMLQLFKVEFYEKGLVYNMPYHLDMEIRVDENWASILLAGFVAAYMGMRSSDGIVLSTIPDIYSRCSLNKWLAINLSSTLENVPTNPTIPYMIYVYLTTILLEDPKYRKKFFPEEIFRLLEETSEERECDIKWIDLRIHRILLAGRAYSEVSREDLRIGGDMAKLINLCTSNDCVCLERLRDVIRRGLINEEPRIFNMATILYEALTGSKNPSEASYYITRIIREQEDKEGITLMGRKCLEKLIETLVS